jgi:hypothetical protein
VELTTPPTDFHFVDEADALEVEVLRVQLLAQCGTVDRVGRQHLSWGADARHSRARKALGWPKICKLAHAFLWEHSYKGEKLAQLLGNFRRYP